MDWVKLSTRYFRDKAIVLRSDQHEVMFSRGLATAGEMESGGFLPDEVIPDLARNKRTARRLASDLATDPNPVWERVTGGYQIINWEEWQKELEALVAKKERERLRKRRDRAAAREAAREGHHAVLGLSADASADSPVGNEAIESKSESKTAAAAAAGVIPEEKWEAAKLPTTIEILRSKMQAHTRLQALRFDLAPDRVAAIEALITLHGDDKLVQIALDTCRSTPPVSVSAFIGTWEALPEPGQRFRVVKTYCPTHSIELSTAGVCKSCAADEKAGGSR